MKVLMISSRKEIHKIFLQILVEQHSDVNLYASYENDETLSLVGDFQEKTEFDVMIIDYEENYSRLEDFERAFLVQRKNTIFLFVSGDSQKFIDIERDLSGEAFFSIRYNSEQRIIEAAVRRVLRIATKWKAMREKLTETSTSSSPMKVLVEESE